MSNYPWDFETQANVSIDAGDILDYVKENQEWFLERMSKYKSCDSIKEEVKDLGSFVDSIIDKYNNVRVFRDASNNNMDDLKVKMYEDLVDIRKTIKTMEG